MKARILEQFLAERGFRRTVQGREIVYVREHEHARRTDLAPTIKPVVAGVRVKVYTSIQIDQTKVRGAGQDAIRVSTAYEGPKPLTPPGRNKPLSKNFGILKTKRIYRTGSEEAILERLYERMCEAYQAGTEYLRDHWKEITSP